MPMTSRERVDAALNHREPHRTPVFEYVLQSPVADRLLGRPYAGDAKHWPRVVEAKGWRGAVEQLALDRVDLALLLGHDMMYVPRNAPCPRTPSKPPAPRPSDADDPVEKIKLRNGVSVSSKAFPDDTLLVHSCVQEEMRRRGVDLPIMAPAYAHGVWTDTDLMQTMILAPEAAHEHFALATTRTLDLIERYIALGIEQVGVGGDFAGTRPIISPQAYRRFIVPEVRKLSRRLHEAGRYAVNASDGNLWSVMDDFVHGCEVDGYLLSAASVWATFCATWSEYLGNMPTITASVSLICSNA